MLQYTIFLSIYLHGTAFWLNLEMEYLSIGLELKPCDIFLAIIFYLMFIMWIRFLFSVVQGLGGVWLFFFFFQIATYGLFSYRLPTEHTRKICIKKEKDAWFYNTSFYICSSSVNNFKPCLFCCKYLKKQNIFIYIRNISKKIVSEEWLLFECIIYSQYVLFFRMSNFVLSFGQK